MVRAHKEPSGDYSLFSVRTVTSDRLGLLFSESQQCLQELSGILLSLSVCCSTSTQVDRVVADNSQVVCSVPSLITAPESARD